MDTLRCHRIWSALFHVMAYCLKAPSHYPNQSWHIISHISLIFGMEIASGRRRVAYNVSYCTSLNMRIMSSLVIWTCCILVMDGPMDLEWNGSDMNGSPPWLGKKNDLVMRQLRRYAVTAHRVGGKDQPAIIDHPISGGCRDLLSTVIVWKREPGICIKRHK